MLKVYYFLNCVATCVVAFFELTILEPVRTVTVCTLILILCVHPRSHSPLCFLVGGNSFLKYYDCVIVVVSHYGGNSAACALSVSWIDVNWVCQNM